MNYNALGWRTGLADGTGATSFLHDDLGRVISLTASNTGTVGYGYNARGQRTQLTYPDSSVIDYSYWDDGNLLNDGTSTGGSSSAPATYDPAGRLASVSRANGATTAYTYDGADRLRDLHTTANDATLARFAYDVDRLGMRRSVTETLVVAPEGRAAEGLVAEGRAAEGLAPEGGSSQSALQARPGFAGATSAANLSSAWVDLDVCLPADGTPTPVPPTSTPVPPTATALPTNTPVPPTATPNETSTPVPPVGGGTRTITYDYDGLNRLIDATYSTGETYGYTYDLAGNRLSAAENGVQVQSRSYNAANQVIGWSYDAAGNLLNDGTDTGGSSSASTTYDALNRLTSQGGASYASNGDGVLVGQTSGGSTTTYAQDLVAPLAQILTDTSTGLGAGGSARYVYGNERLTSSAGDWYIADALGSLRLTLDDLGAPLASAAYDPWGVPQGSMIAPFGFTGELQDAASGMVHLRARWYDASAGRFHSRDPFAGWPETPYSTHYYQYAYSDPVLYTDPSGKVVYLFEGGWNTPSPEGAPDPSNMRQLADYLISAEVPPETVHPLSTGFGSGDANINMVVNDIANRFDGQCPIEPIILIGYSRGGMHAQAVAHRLNIREKNNYTGATISLIVTIGPVEAFQPGWIDKSKQPVVRKHINILSEQGTAAAPLGNPDTTWPPGLTPAVPESSIRGADIEYIEPGTSHFTVVRNPMQRFRLERDASGRSVRRVVDGPAVDPSPVYERIRREVITLTSRVQ
jgi:RHS repeat-associated protein